MSNKIETRTLNVHKLEILIVDHDAVGIKNIKEMIERGRYPNHCIAPRVMSAATKQIEFHDERPLNLISEQEKAYRELFAD